MVFLPHRHPYRYHYPFSFQMVLSILAFTLLLSALIPHATNADLDPNIHHHHHQKQNQKRSWIDSMVNVALKNVPYHGQEYKYVRDHDHISIAGDDGKAMQDSEEIITTDPDSDRDQDVPLAISYKGYKRKKRTKQQQHIEDSNQNTKLDTTETSTMVQEKDTDTSTSNKKLPKNNLLHMATSPAKTNRKDTEQSESESWADRYRNSESEPDNQGSSQKKKKNRTSRKDAGQSKSTDAKDQVPFTSSARKENYPKDQHDNSKLLIESDRYSSQTNETFAKFKRQHMRLKRPGLQSITNNEQFSSISFPMPGFVKISPLCVAFAKKRHAPVLHIFVKDDEQYNMVQEARKQYLSGVYAISPQKTRLNPIDGDVWINSTQKPKLYLEGKESSDEVYIDLMDSFHIIRSFQYSFETPYSRIFDSVLIMPSSRNHKFFNPNASDIIRQSHLYNASNNIMHNALVLGLQQTMQSWINQSSSADNLKLESIDVFYKHQKATRFCFNQLLFMRQYFENRNKKDISVNGIIMPFRETVFRYENISTRGACDLLAAKEPLKISIYPRKGMHRELLNPNDVAQWISEAFEKAGSIVIDPIKIFNTEPHSFSEWVQMFSQSNIVFAPHGAHFVNGMFLPKNGIIIEVSPNCRLTSAFPGLERGVRNTSKFLFKALRFRIYVIYACPHAVEELPPAKKEAFISNLEKDSDQNCNKLKYLGKLCQMTVPKDQVFEVFEKAIIPRMKYRFVGISPDVSVCEAGCCSWRITCNRLSMC